VNDLCRQPVGGGRATRGEGWPRSGC
jgi:hypothetical protein